MFKKFTSEPRILGIQFFSSVLFLLVLLNLNMLPMSYFVVLSVIIFIFFFFIFLKVLQNRKRKRMYNSFKFLSFFTSVCLLISTVYVVQGNSFLNSITGNNYQVHTMSLIILNDSEYDSVEDLDGCIVGINQVVDTNNVLYAVDMLSKEVNFTQSDKSTFESLADALYNESVSAILVSEVYRTTIQNYYENFDAETTVLWSYGITEEIEDFAKTVSVTNTPFNIYISGIDTYGNVNTVSRSDVNMVVTINPVTKEILMTTIPRDLYVPLATSGQEDKLTHAGAYGIQESVQTIENLLDIDINYYARVNFTSIVDIIDAIGGVSVYSKYAFTTLHGNYWINQGYNTMDGDKALCFVRERYSLPNGDYDRGINQTELLKGMIEKVISPTIITNYSSILSAIDGCFTTNMASSDLTSLIKMQLNNMASWTFETQQINGTGGMDYTYSYPSQKLSVQYPDSESVLEVSNKIKSMQN